MSEDTIVGWDGSAAGRAAAEWALDRAALSSTPMRLVHVVTRLDEEDTSPVDAATSELDTEVSRLRLRQPAVELGMDVVVGDVVEQLRALSTPSRLLVVGTDEHLQPRRSTGWSVGARLASSCPGAVAVVPRGQESQRQGIVVGVDTHERDHATLSFAVKEALIRGQTLHLVHAWHRPSPFAVKGTAPDVSSWLAEDHRRELEAMGDDLARDFPELSLQIHLAEGTAAAALHGFAASATTLIVGTRGRGPLRRILLGSTSHSLLLYIDAPTIIVPHSVGG